MRNEKLTGKLMETTDYDMFEMLTLNRPVTQTRALEESMKKYGWIDAYPMHVVRNQKGKLFIKGGHHRFTVARKLGIPVKYIVCEDAGVTIHELEHATSNWTLKDYLESFCNDGREDYLQIKEYHRRTGIKLNACIGMFSGQNAKSASNSRQSFISGVYRIKSHAIATEVEYVVQAIKKAGVSFATNSYLVVAICNFVMTEECDVERLVKKILSNPFMMKRQPDTEEYMNMLEELYNYRSADKVPLSHMAKQAAKLRCAVKRR